MTSCTVLSIEEIEINNFAWWHYLAFVCVAADKAGAGSANKQRPDRSDREWNENSSMIHRD
jgi:hypothetical protein